MLIEEEKIYSPNKINISATRIYLKLFFKWKFNQIIENIRFAKWPFLSGLVPVHQI